MNIHRTKLTSPIVSITEVRQINSFEPDTTHLEFLLENGTTLIVFGAISTPTPSKDTKKDPRV